MKRVSILVLALLLSSCAALNPLSVLSELPNPLEADKGINTNVAIGKTVEANTTKSLVNLDKIDIGRVNSNSSNQADTMTVNNTNINWAMMGALILLAGMAIPTRSQSKQIKQLEENLEYERARTNITVEAAAGATKAGQEARPPPSFK